ncbi:MAG: NAD-dependent epimerase/dehydratase family protein, partial [Pseudomonadota bacterium]
MSKDNASVLVTGGAGFVGSHTVLALKEAGFSPIVYDNYSTGHRDAVFSDDCVEGDVFDKSLLVKTLREYNVSSVIHFAALIEAGHSVVDPLSFYRNNVAASICLFEAMQEVGVERLVFSSTAAVYGYRDFDDALHESLPVAPINPYGKTKAVVEGILADLALGSPLNSIAL